MNDKLRQAAQAVISAWDGPLINMDKEMEALRAALAEPTVKESLTVEPVAWVECEPAAEGARYSDILMGVFYSTKWHFQSEVPVKRKETNGLFALYTTPPNIDALIAEIDGIDCEYLDDYEVKVKAILDKHRGQK